MRPQERHNNLLPRPYLTRPDLTKPEIAMPDPFARLITDARTFLGELAQNNTRDWFAVHKARYDGTLKAPALLLLDQVAHDLGPQTTQGLGVKLFRPYRNVRFSRDKTPYHTHLHMMWTLGAKGRGPAVNGAAFAKEIADALAKHGLPVGAQGRDVNA